MGEDTTLGSARGIKNVIDRNKQLGIVEEKRYLPDCSCQITKYKQLEVLCRGAYSTIYKYKEIESDKEWLCKFIPAK